MTPYTVLSLRHKLSLTQAALAKRMGVTRLTVSRWEMESGDYPIPKTAQFLLRRLLTTGAGPDAQREEGREETP